MFCLQRKKISLPKTDFLEPSHSYFVSCFWEAWIWSWLIVLICGTRRLSRPSPRLHSERSSPTSPLLRSTVAWSLIPSDLWRKKLIESLKEKIKKNMKKMEFWETIFHIPEDSDTAGGEHSVGECVGEVRVESHHRFLTTSRILECAAWVRITLILVNSPLREGCKKIFEFSIRGRAGW